MAGIDCSLENTARFFGADPRTIQRWIRDGCPATKTRGGKWSLNSAAVADWLKDRERRAVLAKISDVNEAEARRRKAAADASLAEHELAVKRGEYVPVSPVRSMLTQLAITQQNLVTRMILELADDIAPENPAEFRERAMPYIERFLLAISDAIRNLPEVRQGDQLEEETERKPPRKKATKLKGR